MIPSTTPRSEETGGLGPRLGWLGAWVLLGTLHVALLFAFVPPSQIFSEQPLQGIDYSLHYYQVDRAARAFRETGHLWSWDPQQVAGYPAGTFEDISSKTLELFVIGLGALGVGQALAFNLYVLVLHLLVPLLAVAAGRLFGLGRGQRFVLALLWVLLWYFDSFLHWCWYCGMISWAFVSALAVVVVGLVYRVFQLLAAGRPGIAWWLAAAAGCAAIGLFHPLAMIIVALPSAALYLRGWRPRPARHHLFVLVCAASATLAALLWLLPAVPVWRYVVRSDFFLRPTPAFVLNDFFDLHLSASATGPPVQTMLRYLCLAAAGLAFLRWRRARDPRTLPLLIMVLTNLVLAYTGRYFSLTSTAQPYRAIAPATFAASVPAAVLLSEVLSWRSLRALSPVAAATLAILAVLVVPRVIHVVLFYFPDIVPFMYFERRLPVPDHPINRVLAAWSRKMENRGPPRAFREMRAWLLANHHGRGRVLVEDYELGEYLAATTDLPILGGFAYRPLQHADANLFQYEAKITKSPDELRAYFERYAIGLVVFHKVHWKLENSEELLEFRTSVGGIDYRAFETRIDPSYLERGPGRVVDQRLNSVTVEGASGPEVVLRFHWLDALRCSPGCRAERFPLEGDRVGFIRVRQPPPRFTIYNSYSYK